MSTFERLTLSEYDDGPCPWPADVYRTALKAAYAENDRIKEEANTFIRELTTRSLDDIPLTAQQRRGLVLLEGLTKFLEGVADAGKPMTTQLVIRDTENGDEFPIIHLWATVDDQDPVAKNRYLREENDNLKAEIENLRAELNDAWMESGHDKATIDRLRASALEWVTVTGDPATLPEEFRTCLVHVIQNHSSIDNPRTAYRVNRLHGKRWVLAANIGNSRIVRPGDRWAYIPEVPHE